MRINIVPLEKNHKLLNCPGNAENNEMFSPVLNALSFGYRENEQQILLLTHQQACSVMELQAEENETIDIFTAAKFLISNFMNKNKIDMQSAFLMIDTFFNVKSDLPVQRTIYPLFALLGWLPSKKGEDAYRAFPNFSEKLRSMLQNKKVGLNEAFLFHLHLSEYSYDEILEEIPENLSFSETNYCLKTMTEIIQNRNADCLGTNTDYIDKMLKKLADSKNKSDFIAKLKQLRYPKTMQTKERFADYVSAFKFPSGVFVVTDEFFEKNTVNMEISFNSKKNLEQKLTQILTQLKTQEKSPDYFCIETLLGEK